MCSAPATLSVFAAAASLVFASAEPPAAYHPVFIAGPLLAQNLEIKNSIPHSLCNTRGEFRWLWGNPNLTAADSLCLLEGLSLGGFDPKKGLSVPKKHVEVRLRGGLNGTGFPAFGSFFGAPLIDGEAGQTHLLPMLRARGFVEDTSVFEVRYDWRLSVGDWQTDVFPLTRQKIEMAVQKASGRGAVLTGLSMAGPFLHSFMTWANNQDAGWTRKYVHAFVPVGGPWNGAVMALSAILGSSIKTFSTEGLCPRCDPPRKSKAMPDPSSTSIIDQFTRFSKLLLDGVLGQVIHTMPSMFYMSTGIDYSTAPPRDSSIATLKNGKEPPACLAEPRLSAACGADRTRSGVHFDDPTFLNQTQCAQCHRSRHKERCPEGYDLASRGLFWSLCCKRHSCEPRSYRTSELPELLKQLGRPKEAQLMQYAFGVGTTEDPGVPVHCIYSRNVQTFSYLLANMSHNLGREDVVLDDGDQTVDSRSSEICNRWPSTIKVYRVPGVLHASLLDIRQVNDVIVAVATNATEVWSSWKEPKMSELIYANKKSVAPRDELLVADAASIAELVV